MRVAQIRIIAWGLAVLCAVVVLLQSGKSGSETRLREPGDDVAPAAPGLLRDGPAAAIQTVPMMAVKPIETVGLRSLTVRDSQPPGDHVIHEPTGPGPRLPAIESELAAMSPYQLGADSEPTERKLSQLPLELLLNEPQREDAAVKPRVAQDASSEPVFASPPPAPLPKSLSSDPAMQPVNSAAREHVVRGFSLGDRAAVFAARTEFIQALRTIAQALDAQAGLMPNDSKSCSQALVLGLQALKEADDFNPSGSQLDGELDLTAMIAAHRTPACKQSLPASQLAALQSYFNYARAELQRAAGGNPVASQALGGLGKSYTVLTEKNPGRLASAKAMVFHQAAVGADPGNHLAANELGVLFAKHGQWEPAKQSFLQSLRIQSDAAAWQNLAAVHGQLGEPDLAQLAEHERQLLLGKGAGDNIVDIEGKPTVQWVDPKAFAGPPEDALPTAAKVAPDSVLKKSSKSPNRAAQKSDAWSWLPWK